MYREQHFSSLVLAFFFEDLRENLYVDTGVFDIQISNFFFDLPEKIPNFVIYDLYLVRYFLVLQPRAYKFADGHSLHPLHCQKSHVLVSFVIRFDKNLVNNSENTHKVFIRAANNRRKWTIRRNNRRVP